METRTDAGGVRVRAVRLGATRFPDLPPTLSWRIHWGFSSASFELERKDALRNDLYAFRLWIPESESALMEILGAAQSYLYTGRATQIWFTR